MFTNKSKDVVPTPAAPQAPAKRTARPSAPSIISSDLVVTGTLKSKGDMQIDGCVEGDVHSANLVIGDKAQVHGEVFAEDVIIRGKVQGSIRAHKVHLAASCHVEGNILHEALTVEQGAFFEGNCRHSNDPLGLAEKGVAFESKPDMDVIPIPPHSLKGMNGGVPSLMPAAAKATVAPHKNGNGA